MPSRPDPPLNMRLPMIVAPAFASASVKSSSSMPVSPPSLPCELRKLAVETTHSWSRSP